MFTERPKFYAEYIALVVFGISSLVLVPAVLFVRLPYEKLSLVVIIVLALCVILISTVTYQSLSTYVRTYKMAQKLSKDLLIHSRELFYELYRNSPVPYILIDMEGKVESANTSAIRFFGVHEGALDGTDFFTYIEDDGTNKTNFIPAYFKQGKPISDAEVSLHKADGTIRYAILSIFLYKDVEGRQKGLLTLVDITKQKMVDKAKTEFVSLASHQLRTPISSLRWNVELFEGIPDVTLTDTQRQYLRKITDGIARMDSLVTDFLSVSKLELGTLKPHYETFELSDFLGSLHEEFRLHAEKKNVTFETNWSEQFGPITSDTRLLNMALGNLLSNAIKYTPQNGVVRGTVTLSESTITFRIEDSGIGIPGSDHEMIFSKLFRASNVESKGIDGTGLGLYIVKEALRVIGGTISFESREGVGTTFIAVIPRR
ncbi:MAG: PAS domain-containing sensor histidine kinase [Candidatus Kaiserbacteria bacterium]|nr:PAS domain-containing sensor histidine kinase [Candidatus Kaiserbacteria bacterium]